MKSSPNEVDTLKRYIQANTELQIELSSYSLLIEVELSSFFLLCLDSIIKEKTTLLRLLGLCWDLDLITI